MGGGQLIVGVIYFKKNCRPWQDSNLQSPDPKSGALSIRPHGRSYLNELKELVQANRVAIGQEH